MRNFKARKGAALLLVVILACLYPAVLRGNDGETSVTSSSESQVVTNEDVGTGIFSRLPFHVSVSVRGGYDDNIFTSSSDRHESWFTNAGVAVTYDFGSPRTQLSLGTGAGVTYYFDRPGDDEVDPNVYLSLSATHKATPRLTLSTVAYATYQAEPDFSLGMGLNRRSGNFFYTQDKFTVTYLWAPRFATATSYTFGAIRYDEMSVGFFEDRIENTVGNEFRFLLWPTTTVVAEYRFGMVAYEDINRDSGTHFALAGLDHSFNPRLNASFRGGVEFRDYCDNTNGNDRTSPYFEGTVNYALGKNTSVSWTNRYAIEEPDVLLNPSRNTFRTGLRAKHNFTPRISGMVGAYYQYDDYHDLTMPVFIATGFQEESFDVAVTVRYSLNRLFAIEAGYNHTEIISDIFSREYSRNRFFGGLNLAF